ncbi:glycosyltransferase [Polaribacter sp. Hel_I_88]|uniref:glycosyltransferase n=1 Tax=Polaribacter sp. Hel_I_88 TaxID=1250006 RepID=UPI0006893FD2|nr:glycosyltransferase [Polaribacter sp. Hel_I_88]
MNTGVIIIFSKEEEKINDTDVDTLVNQLPYNLCFVNNGKKDDTLSFLLDIKEHAKTNVVVVDLKKENGLKNAIKAGARLLLSDADYDFIIYLKSNMIQCLDSLNEYIKEFKNKKELFTAIPSRSQRSVLNDVFPISEFLKIKKHVPFF